QRLWHRLSARAAENPSLRQVAERLSALLARADFVPPYELYAEILGADGGRHALRARLGMEAEDPIDEFLALALAYEREHAPSLKGFLGGWAPGDPEVRRDFGARQRDEVRILTVHGAKGLEAPVVFLPDTAQQPNPPDTFCWSERDALPLWRPPRIPASPFYAAEREAARVRNLQEYRRLVYLAPRPAQGPPFLFARPRPEPANGTPTHSLPRP